MMTLSCSLIFKPNAYEKKSIAKFKHRCIVSFQAFLISVSNIKRPKGPSLYVCSDEMLACECVCACVRAQESRSSIRDGKQKKNILADLIKPTFMLIDFFFCKSIMTMMTMMMTPIIIIYFVFVNKALLK
jgi:hypothetical protein